MRHRIRLMLTLFVLIGFTAALPTTPATAADAVVGAPCTEADFDAALATVESTGGGTITFNCGSAEIITFTTEKTISTAVQIDGADLLTLSGGGTTRHFHVLAGGNLTLERIILEEGYVPDDEDGGSILLDDGGALTVLNSTLRSNRGAFGGAIYTDAALLGITVTIDGSTLVENEATNGSGGALYVDGGARLDGSGATVTISASLLADNFATDAGGAIHIEGGGFDTSTGGSVQISESALLRNVTESGGGGAVYIDGGAFNDATGGAITITASTLAGNVAGSVGGAIYNTGGAFNNSTGGSVLIRRSTLAENTASSHGGAIYNTGGFLEQSTGGDVQITNSTLSGNVAESYGGAIYSGPGYDPNTTGGVVTIWASTVTQNDSLSDTGDGLFNATGTPASRMKLRLSIVAENDTGAGGVDCAGAIFSDGRNLDSDDTCQLVRSYDVPAGNAALLPLADNGGPTETHMPSATSDALNAGPTSCINQDQRQQPRPGGDSCDIGAVEYQPLLVLPLTLCVHRFTGQVHAPTTGVCDPAVYYAVDMPSAAPQTFCYEPVSGALTHALSGACPANRIAHVTPADGDLLTCLDIFTGIHRWTPDLSLCSANERPVVVPAA